MNTAVFGKILANVRKHRDINLATAEARRNYLVSEPNDHTATFFSKVYQKDFNRNEENPSTHE